jgi:hypothetical protein
VAALYANKSQTATGPQAEFWQQMLQDQLARRTAEMGGGAWNAPAADAMAVDGATYEGGAPEYHAPGETRQDAQGNTWRWNEQAGRGEMIQKAPTFAELYDMQQEAQKPQYTYTGNNIDEGAMYGPYGEGSVTHDEVPTTFTNAHGSALGSMNFTGPQMGTQSAAEFWQDAADYKRHDNRFASQSPGYGNNPLRPNTPSWAAYDRAMKAKKLLGSR